LKGDWKFILLPWDSQTINDGLYSVVYISSGDDAARNIPAQEDDVEGARSIGRKADGIGALGACVRGGVGYVPPVDSISI